MIAYAYGRTGDNPRGIYLVPLRAFRGNKIHKVVADKKYRIKQNAESFAQYMENYFAALFAKRRKKWKWQLRMVLNIIYWQLLQLNFL